MTGQPKYKEEGRNGVTTYTFTFNGKRIRVVKEDKDLWHSVIDVCKALDFPSAIIQRIPADYKREILQHDETRPLCVNVDGFFWFVDRVPAMAAELTAWWDEAINFYFNQPDHLPAVRKPEPLPTPTMTVREVADATGVPEQTIRNAIRRVFPDLMRNGIATYLNEAQASEISKEIKRSHNSELSSTGQVPTTDIEMMEQGARFAAWAMGKIKAQEEKIAADKPKVDTFDRLISANGTYTMSEVAKMLGFGPVVFGRKLEADGYVFRRGRRWLPIQRFVDAEWFVLKALPVGHEEDGSAIIVEQIRVTPKGLDGLSHQYPTPEAIEAAPRAARAYEAAR